MTDPAVSADARLAHAGTRATPGEPAVQPPVLASILASAGRAARRRLRARRQPDLGGAGAGPRRDRDARRRGVQFRAGRLDGADARARARPGRDPAAARRLLQRAGARRAPAAARRRASAGRPGRPGRRSSASSRRRAAPCCGPSPRPIRCCASLTWPGSGALAAAAGAPMIVDNTVATGLLQRPLDLGAVASLCSLTKSASGHSDVIAGAVMTRDPGWRTSCAPGARSAAASSGRWKPGWPSAG